MQIDGVFSGGGVKAYAFIGAVKKMEEKGLIMERVAGTSAGAIIASLLVAEYKNKEIEAFMEELDLKDFLDPPKLAKWLPFTKWLFLYFQLGINKGNKLEKWLAEKLAAKQIFTFQDIKVGYLKVVVSDISLGKLVVIPDDLERIYGIHPEEFPVAKAIRMSAGFPYFFMPQKIKGSKQEKSLIIDGGLLSNFPLWIFEKKPHKRTRPIIGVKLTTTPTQELKPRKIKNALHMFHALFLTMKEAHDARYISTSEAKNIVFISLENIESTDLYINKTTKEALIQAGYAYTEKFLERWPK